MNIVTGYKGTPHISSGDMQALNQGLFGRDSYILDVGNKLSAELSDVNTVTLSDGDGVIQGVHFRIEPGDSESVNIANGSVGMNRIDLICARYTKNASTGIESVDLTVIQGEESASDPIEPEYNEGDILSGASPVDFPLYKVELNGLTPTLTSYITIVSPLDLIRTADIKNQITLSKGTNCGTVTLNEAYRSGNIVFLKFTVTPSASISSGGNVDVTLSGITPVSIADNRIGYGVSGVAWWACWLTSATNIRVRRMASDAWTTSISPIITGMFFVK